MFIYLQAMFKIKCCECGPRPDLDSPVFLHHIQSARYLSLKKMLLYMFEKGLAYHS